MPVEVNRSSHPSQSRVSRNSLCRYRSCSTSSFRSLAGAKLDAVAILEALKTACLADTFRTFLHVFGPGSEHFTHRHFAETVHRSSNIVRNAVLTGIAVKTDPFARLLAVQSFLAAPEIDQVISVDQGRGGVDQIGVG